jgi:holo-[acyl-carrier protein] synthase
VGVIGIGTDLVEIERFRLALRRTPRLPERLFSEAERAYAARRRDPTERLAARFAAKEAVMKAMGVGLWRFPLRDIEVVRATSGAPSVRLHGGAARLAAQRGVTEWRLTLTHTATLAQAIAVAL